MQKLILLPPDTMFSFKSINLKGKKSKIGIFGLLEGPFIVAESYFWVNIMLIIVYYNENRYSLSINSTFKTKEPLVKPLKGRIPNAIYNFYR